MFEEGVFDRWREVVLACHRQVEDSVANTDRGEVALAHIAIAVMLEGYVTQWARHYLPASALDAFLKMSVADRCKLLPRLLLKERNAVEAYEAAKVHELVAEIFEVRNKVAHGNLRKWTPRPSQPGHRLAVLWNAACDVLIGLETVGDGFRIPRSRLADFTAEVDAMRLPVTDAGA